MSSVTEAPAVSARSNSTSDVLAEHRSAGRAFTAAGIRSFVRAEGNGPSVLCMHGMWGSSLLELDRFHLVVHDIGGPVGFELASRLPDRVASLTIFNTMIDVTTFTPPWSMRPFRYRGLGELWLKGLNKPMFAC